MHTCWSSVRSSSDSAPAGLVSSLVVGDDVISSAGIYGTITALDEQVAVLRVADGVEIRLARATIARRVGLVEGDPDGPDPDLTDDGQ